MARVGITITDLAGGKNPANVVVPVTAGDNTNEHSWTAKAGDMLFVHNEDAGNVVVTLVSVADRQGRTTDEAVTIAADARYVFGPLTDLLPWAQPDGTVHVDVDTDTTPKLAVLRP